MQPLRPPAAAVAALAVSRKVHAAQSPAAAANLCACCALAAPSNRVLERFQKRKTFPEYMVFWVSNKCGVAFLVPILSCLGQASVHPTQGHSKLRPCLPKRPSGNDPKGWRYIPMRILVLSLYLECFLCQADLMEHRCRSAPLSSVVAFSLLG